MPASTFGSLRLREETTMRRALRFLIGSMAGIGGLAAVGTGVTLASPPILAAAVKAGVPAKDCQYCHTDAFPKPETYKPETLNDRGKFLLTDKQQRGLKAVDVEKLKEFGKK
jgi:Rieske Fe-S protein